MSLESALDLDNATAAHPERKQKGQAEGPSSWPSILAGLCQVIHGTSALVATTDRSRRRVSIHGAVNISARYLQSYETDHVDFDPFIGTVVGSGDTGAIWTASEGDRCDANGSSDFFARWLRPQGISHVTCGLLATYNLQTTYLIIGRPREAGTFGTRDVELLGSLLPCIRMTFQSSRLIEGVHDERQTLLSLVDKLPTGVVLLNRRRQPVFINSYAKRALADIGDLDSFPPQLCQVRQQEHIRSARGRALTALGEGMATGGVHVVQRSSGQRPLSIIVQQLHADDSDSDDGRPAFALIISDPDRAIELDEAALCRLYGLTPAEGRLAALLASGKHIESAAHLLGVSIHTVRTHLKHIFSKTETSSQSDLVRLILSSPSPIRTA